MKKTLVRLTARTMIITLAYQLVFPVYAMALTTGPSQPEVQSFEPVGTTEMVDMFTGDFNYNIPLLDVEGYPVNISYHSGIGVEQEASWVGLGWNINPGEINRAMRGLPDDFNGDIIDKELKINPEKNFRVGLGINVGFELCGFDTKKYGLDLSLGFSNYVQFNNYKGMSVGFNTSATLSTPVASVGVDMGIGSQTGADVDANASLHTPRVVTENTGSGIGVSGGTGFNSRSGLKDLSFGASFSSKALAGPISYNTTVPIGLQNYVPIVTNPSTLNSFEFQGRFGGEIFYTFPNVYMSIQKSTLSYVQDGSRKGYGYLYEENAADDAIVDFSREKDGYYNSTLKNLPLSSMTYDVYSISGQGAGGVFRPFRNDIGSIYDASVKSPASSNISALIEGGIGNLFEIGTDVTFLDNESDSGPWNRLSFRGGDVGSLYEKLFFKQAGELTYNNQQVGGIFDDEPVYLGENMSSLNGKSGGKGSLPAKYGNASIYWNSGVIDRTSRANLLTYLTAEEASIPGVGQDNLIRYYEKYGVSGSSPDFYNPNAANTYSRYTSGMADKAQSTHISEFTQTLADGRRYVYGLPAMNNLSREVTVSVDPGNADLNTGLVTYTEGASVGKEGFYSSTTTPAYAHSYLLTSVLSNDYVDVLGDGATDDDLGGWVKFNYTLWDGDYRWRAPYEGNKAQYNPGFWADNDDDKGNYVIGSRQQWHIRSIESKNYVAEFYVSQRSDGKGVTTPVYTGSKLNVDGALKTTKSGNSYSYELDSIKLYNKHDRYINKGNATPIKTVIFQYDYSLCTGIPNGSSGKLTLKKIFTRYGKSDKNLLSPYVFTYANANPSYNFADKDRWGCYKDHSKNTSLTTYEFPYTQQDGTGLDADAAPWNLTDIKLPSGGKINIIYESDDYSYVQDRRTMQMFQIEGIGNSDKLDHKSTLYEDLNNVNDYVYFKRITGKENPNLTMKDNYLEGNDLLYYSFNLDITGTGRYEHIKGYAKVDAVGVCSDDTTYGYIKLHKEHPGNNSALLHPATIYGINTGKYYLPHLMYPGFKGGDDGEMAILRGLLAAAEEMLTITKNPIVRFIEQRKVAKNIKIEKSFIRLARPGLSKKGGGIRVKELTLNDSWSTLTSNPNSASYGKDYDYTISDSKYGTISSGVASYEPIVGGDENPFRMPVPYTADEGRLMPATIFFQEEPFGESFFPPPVVGYSKVTVKSIHAAEGRSSQSKEEYAFYTAKDFPIEVDYTNKNAPPPEKTKSLRKKTEVVKAFQGYVLRFNDMHGKPKSIKNYNIKTDGSNVQYELVSSVKYNYNTDQSGKLNNSVLALSRKRGQNNTYEIKQTTLGEEADFTVDTRERYNKSYRRSIDINVNVVLFAIIPIPIPTAFFPEKEESTTFRSMVSTKVIQKYGILKSVENFDHGATTVIENVIYDSETGGVLLTKTNNQYANDIYDLKYPAYWAYEGMGPAYTNVGYEETADSLRIENRTDPSVSCVNSPTFYGRLYLKKDRFFPGDELLLTYNTGTAESPQIYKAKVWVMDEYPMLGPICPSWTTPYPVPGYLSPISVSNARWVVLRALQDKNATLQWPGGLVEGSSVKSVKIKVLRSGRRNDLGKSVQQTKMTQNPYTSSISDILGGSSAFDNVLSVSVQDFTKQGTPFGSQYSDGNMYGSPAGDYDPLLFPVNNDSANVRLLNRYVLGHEGNFRPLSEYTYIAQRSYATNNVKTDGKFGIRNHPFWNNQNGASGPRAILSAAMGNAEYWRCLHRVMKYDVLGNAVEEMDASGKRVSSQYGYARSLPTAVASNVQQRSFFYEGFEDFSMLMPKNMYFLYKPTYYFKTPFAQMYNALNNSLSATYYGQAYRQYAMVQNGDSITSTTSHSGNYSLRCSASRTLDIYATERNGELSGHNDMIKHIENFQLDANRKYVVSLWLKPTSGTAASAIGSIGVAYVDSMIGSTVFYPFQLKTSSIDGWYKAEYVTPGMIEFFLTLPANVYFDDIRMVPLDASMKSFVYDPITYKLSAQLDENNFATFYEYDQEGLLVRVKKETDRGIATVSESRRSNSKK